MSTSRLAYWRKRRGLTQEALAALAGVTQAAVSQMERAQRAPKGLYSALKLAAACGTTVEAIWPDVRPQPYPTHRRRQGASAGTGGQRTALKNQGKRKG